MIKKLEYDNIHWFWTEPVSWKSGMLKNSVFKLAKEDKAERLTTYLMIMSVFYLILT
jgi:hypothetical protein